MESPAKRRKIPDGWQTKVMTHALETQMGYDAEDSANGMLLESLAIGWNISTSWIWWDSALVLTCWYLYTSARKAAGICFSRQFGHPQSLAMALRTLFKINKEIKENIIQLNIYESRIKLLESNLDKFRNLRLIVEDNELRVDLKDPKSVRVAIKLLWNQLDATNQLALLEELKAEITNQLNASFEELASDLRVVFRKTYNVSYSKAGRTTKLERRRLAKETIDRVAGGCELELIVDLLEDYDLKNTLLSQEMQQWLKVAEPLDVNESLALLVRAGFSHQNYHIIHRLSKRLQPLSQLIQLRDRLLKPFDVRPLDVRVDGKKIDGREVPLHIALEASVKKYENIVKDRINDTDRLLEVIVTFEADGVNKEAHNHAPEIKQKDSKLSQMCFYIVGIAATSEDGTRRLIWDLKTPGSGAHAVPIFVARCDERYNILRALCKGQKEIIHRYRLALPTLCGLPTRLLDCWAVDQKMARLLVGLDGASGDFPTTPIEIYRNFWRSPWRMSMEIDQVRDECVMELQAQLARTETLLVSRLRELARIYAQNDHPKFRAFRAMVDNCGALKDDTAVKSISAITNWLAGFRAGITEQSVQAYAAMRNPSTGLHMDESVVKVLIKLATHLAANDGIFESLLRAWRENGLDECKFPDSIQGNTSRKFVGKMPDWIPSLDEIARRTPFQHLIELWSLLRAVHRAFSPEEAQRERYTFMAGQFLLYMNVHFGDFPTRSNYLVHLIHAAPRIVKKMDTVVPVGRIIEDGCEHLNQLYKNANTNGKTSTKNNVSEEQQLLQNQVISSMPDMTIAKVEKIINGEPQKCKTCQEKGHKKPTCGREDILLNAKLENIPELELPTLPYKCVDSDLSSVDKTAWNTAANAAEAALPPNFEKLPARNSERKQRTTNYSLVAEWLYVSCWPTGIIATNGDALQLKLGTGRNSDVFTIVWNCSGEEISLEFHYAGMVSVSQDQSAAGMRLSWQNIPSVMRHRKSPGGKEVSKGLRNVPLIELWIPRLCLNSSWYNEDKKIRFKLPEGETFWAAPAANRGDDSED